MKNEMRFAEVRRIMEAKGYSLARIHGSYHIFVKPGWRIESIPVHHGKVKLAYVRKIEKL